jgi:phosphohistidine swiveling domain-containing protein
MRRLWVFSSGRITNRECGGKAAGLRLLGDLGFSVPPWFCVPVSVFRSVAGQAARSFDRRLATARPDDHASIETICRESAKLASAAVSRERAKGKKGVFFLISTAASELLPGTGSFAVRSSACAEDAREASFAGQFDSFLNVPAADVGSAVARCWMGYFKPSAARYRLTRSSSSRRAKGMAVIIQEMVEAVSSGVAFSVNPNGDLGTIVVNAVRGPGQALVQGRIDADSSFIDRSSFAVRTPTAREGLAAGAMLEAPAPKQGVSRILDHGLARKIARLCLEAERAQGAWADVEWAWDGKLRALQLRPATGMPHGPTHILDNSNIVESYPGLSSPLTFSFVKKAYEALFRNIARRLGIDERRLAEQGGALDGMVTFFMGRIYYDLGNWYALYSLVPFSSRIVSVWERMLGIRQARRRRQASGLRCIFSKPARILQDMKVLMRIVSELARLDSSMGRLLARFDAMEADFESRVCGGIVESEIEPLYREITARMLDGWELTLLNDSFAFDMTGLSQYLITKICPGADSAGILNGLLCGLKRVESLEPARLAVGLAEILRDHPSLVARARAAADSGSARIAAGGASGAMEAEARRFDAGFAEYLRRYGARSVEELKLETPSYAEAPWILLRRIIEYAEGGMSAAMIDEREREVRERAQSSLAAGRPSLASRLLLIPCLRLAGRTISYREASRLRRCRFYRMVRRIFLAQARVLTERGDIDAPEDIFYLTEKEALGGSKDGGSGLSLRDEVAARKAAAIRYGGLTPPERILWKGDLRVTESAVMDRLTTSRTGAAMPREGAPQTLERTEAGCFIQGIGCSLGKARAAALVVTDPDAVCDASGKILVARSTDPGWVFLLLQAAGLVAEKGSLLSHTAIIGRELGIPTIVGAIDATKRIRTGDIVEMECGTGRVFLAPRERDRSE